MKEQFIKHKKSNLFVKKTDNSDRNIIFISGFTADHSIWDSVISKLKSHFCCICFDNQGIGKTSTTNTENLTIDDMADDLFSIVKNLSNNKKVTLIGHSMGGAIAQSFANKYSAYTDKIFLINSFMKIDAPFEYLCNLKIRMYEQQVDHRIIADAATPWAFGHKFLISNSHDLISTGDTDIQTISQYKHQLNALLNFDSTQWFENLDVPIAIYTGEQDLIVPWSSTKAMITKRADAIVEIAKGIGHVPQLEDEDGLVNFILNNV